ncbi:MAG: AtpZ/AtpI family protein [Acetatifactor sp.]|nr:AtpZ/AtpI family protein [Acetatifactor sp.]
MAKKKKIDSSVYRALTLILQFGLNMIVPIFMMTFLGIFIDKKAGTGYWVVILFFVGAIAGGQNIYRMAKGIYEKPKEDKTSKRENDNIDRTTKTK